MIAVDTARQTAEMFGFAAPPIAGIVIDGTRLAWSATREDADTTKLMLSLATLIVDMASAAGRALPNEFEIVVRVANGVYDVWKANAAMARSSADGSVAH